MNWFILLFKKRRIIAELKRFQNCFSDIRQCLRGLKYRNKNTKFYLPI